MMTPKLAQKIAAISAAIEPLEKGTENREAGFRYPSIDEYYAKVASAVIAGGIIWTIDQDDVDVLEIDDGLVRFDYLFTVINVEDGESFALRQSVLHPLQGAQTTGSAASYAEKIFLRTLFKIVTGEPDADFFAKRKGQPPRRTPQLPAKDVADDFTAPAPTASNDNKPEEPKPRTRRQVQQVADAEPEEPATADERPPPQAAKSEPRLTQEHPDLVSEMKAATDLVLLKAWKRAYQPTIDDMKANDAELFAELQALYSATLERLKKVS